MMTNPSLDTTTRAASPSRPSSADGDDLQRLGERFEQALRDVEDRSADGGEAAADPPNADTLSRQAAQGDERGEHDAHDDATDDLAAVALAAINTPPLQAASTAQAATVGAAGDPALAASATQGAIGAGLGSTTASVLAARGESASAWSLTLPGLQAWSMQATQPQAGGAWTLDLVASAGHDALQGAAAAIAGATAKIDAATLAAQAQVLSQRLASRDIAVDRVTLRRRGVGDAADDHVVADAAVPGAIDAARGQRRRG